MEKQAFIEVVRRSRSWIHRMEEAASRIHQEVNQMYDDTLPYGFHLRLTAACVSRYGYEVARTEADVLIHPEASCSHDERVLNHPRTFMYSTAGILKHAKESPKKQFVIATELGTLHQLRKDNPEKEFIPIHSDLICTEMKKITLENLLEALEKEQYEVHVPQEIRERAIVPIQRMVNL